MVIRKLLVLAAVVASGWFGVAAALDSPHDGSFDSGVTQCQSCHKLHSTTGTLLDSSKFSSNNDSCLTCHDAATSPNHFFSPAWSPAGRQAVPGVGGDQHNWSNPPTGAGARIPTDPKMALYFTSGQTLQCASCHDVHGHKDAGGNPDQGTLAPNSIHASWPFDTEEPPISGGTGRMKLISVTDGGYNAAARGYAVRVKSGGSTLEISHDFESDAGATWNYSIPFTVGTTSAYDVWLDDPSVVIRITKPPAVGDTWKFYVSFPFLRATNVSDAMCTDCHVDRHQSYLNVEGTGPLTGTNQAIVLGTTVFSHPVNQTLNANGKGYDVASGIPLDADGSPTSSGSDGLGNVPNPSNDLKLDPVTGSVGCTTCHAPHNADSNSLTVEVR